MGPTRQQQHVDRTKAVLDGVYLNRDGVPVFHEAAPPSTDELEAVLRKIITRTMRLLTRLGALIEEPERTSGASGSRLYF